MKGRGQKKKGVREERGPKIECKGWKEKKGITENGGERRGDVKVE